MACAGESLKRHQSLQSSKSVGLPDHRHQKKLIDAFGVKMTWVEVKRSHAVGQLVQDQLR